MAKKRLQDNVDPSVLERPVNLSTILNEEVTIESVAFGEGRYGPNAIMKVIRETGEILRVITSGVVIMELLTQAIENDALPCTATFIRPEQTYTLMIT